ncbi:hypothetical protein [Mycobacterium lepromatosis]|uniref:hypothetical protein n=1 Tax=Mycobacterium lepromatosis TaxID=480418 RepID=UPI000AC2A2B1|nr:hypothetical protein [Mycobacterium lepromatosis]
MSETFNALLAKRLDDSEFAWHYAAELARIGAIDPVLNQLDDSREAVESNQGLACPCDRF